MVKQLLCAGLVLLGWTSGASAQTTYVEYIHTDALGSPVATTDAAGVVVEQQVYEPYGAPIAHGPTDGPGYTGHVEDSATGLTYMQQRYYDPSIGRFLSVDPVTAYENPIGAFNRYWYANNNPYKFTDPDGRQSKELGRWARALWDNNGDFDKAKAQVDKQHEMDKKIASTIVDFTAGGVVKDAVEVTMKVANGQDATGQGTGAVVGEVAGQVTEAILDGKIGDGPASVVGAVVGKATGDTVESVVDSSRSGSSSNGSANGASAPMPKPPEPPLHVRDKVGDK
jgi:RHS repeat-associated protein